MSTAATQLRELLPGYRAIKRLGAGGYGEVWRAEAPGGLEKAVKLIYGFVGDERAERELKALHRIKEVRHPFVLSLERIEIIDGRVMIVTELADMSLMDRYGKCCDERLPGIPHPELLQYLQDTADALDYMQQHHSLQHLDVKPENLLIVGGRAKVADFGLVKELTDLTRSLVGAMTPTYAAPELFDGRASEFCDQYSLAIVYQEMLTGALPFPGTTAHQLAAQHTQSPPQLAALPECDRPIIARALAKNPQDRFPTCAELVRALAAAPSATGPAQIDCPGRDPKPAQKEPDTRTLGMEGTKQTGRHDPHAETDEPTPAVQATEMISRERLSSRSIHVAPKPTMQRPVLDVGTEIVDLPPPKLHCSDEPTLQRPTLLIGVGGTGIEILGKLNHLLQQRRDQAGEQPQVHMLAFDTDRQAAMQAARKGMDPDDVVPLRLRPAHEYRADSEALLKWIGRRWLYNIPKSLETGGFRPLGRLALVDHAGAVVSKLRRRLSKLLENKMEGDAENNAEGAAEQAVAVPRVVIVGACSGGTGGGMLLEMAYAVQNVARQLGHEDIEQMALVAHATNRCRTNKQLAQANAYSFLAELQHYMQYGSRSPEGAMPQAAVYEGESFPATNCYFYHLGDDLDAAQYEDKTRRAAEYLYANVATPLREALMNCRDESAEDHPQECDVRLRSFRIQSHQGVGRDAHEKLQDAALAQVVDIWFAKGRDQAAPAQENPSGEIAPAEAAAKGIRQSLAALGPAMIASHIDRWQRGQLLHNPGEEPVPPQQCEALAAQIAALCEQLQELRSQVGDTAPSLAAVAQPISVSESHLQERIAQAAAPLAEDVLQRSLETIADHSTRRGKDKSPLLDLLMPEVARAATAVLEECLPQARLTAGGEIHPHAAAVAAEAAQAPQLQVGCRRRTLVLRPATFEIDAAISTQLQRECGFIDGDIPVAVVCEELDHLSLAQVAHTIIAGDSETRTVAVRLHSRADILWTEPPLVKCASNPDDSPARSVSEE